MLRTDIVPGLLKSAAGATKQSSSSTAHTSDREPDNSDSEVVIMHARNPARVPFHMAGAASRPAMETDNKAALGSTSISAAVSACVVSKDFLREQVEFFTSAFDLERDALRCNRTSFAPAMAANSHLPAVADAVSLTASARPVASELTFEEEDSFM